MKFIISHNHFRSARGSEKIVFWKCVMLINKKEEDDDDDDEGAEAKYELVPM